MLAELLSSCGGDRAALAMFAVARRMGLSDEEAKSRLRAVLAFQRANSIWPDGFMP